MTKFKLTVGLKMGKEIEVLCKDFKPLYENTEHQAQMTGLKITPVTGEYVYINGAEVVYLIAHVD